MGPNWESTLKKFFTEEDTKDLWARPDKGLYHTSANVSQLYDRKTYNEAFYQCYGKPINLEVYTSLNVRWPTLRPSAPTTRLLHHVGARTNVQVEEVCTGCW